MWRLIITHSLLIQRKAECPPANTFYFLHCIVQTAEALDTVLMSLMMEPVFPHYSCQVAILIMDSAFQHQPHELKLLGEGRLCCPINNYA